MRKSSTWNPLDFAAKQRKLSRKADYRQRTNGVVGLRELNLNHSSSRQLDETEACIRELECFGVLREEEY